MDTSQQPLLKILQIARENSFRGSGISLAGAIRQARYIDLRASFGPEDLIPLLASNAELIDDWLLHSGDKRTDGGWYVTEAGEVGMVSGGPVLQCADLATAVSEYVVRELDFCSGLAG